MGHIISTMPKKEEELTQERDELALKLRTLSEKSISKAFSPENSKYLGVTEVIKRGRYLGEASDLTIPGDEKEVRSDEILIGIVSNGLWAIAPKVDTLERYTGMYEAYMDKHYLTFKLYALPKDEVKNCPDEGRVITALLNKTIDETFSRS